MRSMVEGFFRRKSPLHRTACGPPPLQKQGRKGSIPSGADRRAGREGRAGEEEEGGGAEQLQRAGIVAALDIARAENQQRHGERQDQEAGERAASPEARGQGGDAQGQGSEAGRADQQASSRRSSTSAGSFINAPAGIAASMSGGPKASQWAMSLANATASSLSPRRLN